MGCQSSRNQVNVAECDNPTDSLSSNLNKTNGIQSSEHTYNKFVATDSDNCLREHSASSKASKHSYDSGFCPCDNDNCHITEDSSSDVVKQILEGFESPHDLELGIVGVACPQRLSAKDKERVEEQRVLASLQKEGLISRSLAKTSSSVCFEVVANGPLPPLKPPPRLEKLKKKKKKRQKLTEEEINNKLEQAEERRKELERQRLQRIQIVANQSDVQNCLDKFEIHQKTKESNFKSKEEIAAERKEQKLLELQAKLQARKEHAERVRQRKRLNIDTELDTDLNAYS